MAQTRSSSVRIRLAVPPLENPDTGWEKVTIPHTARIEDLVVKNQYQGRFIYKNHSSPNIPPARKHFFISKA
ncbi:MAG: hypothetical protein U0T56_00065 [Ferruginibacter sp.]